MYFRLQSLCSLKLFSQILFSLRVLLEIVVAFTTGESNRQSPVWMNLWPLKAWKGVDNTPEVFSGWTQLFTWHFNSQSTFFLLLFRICCWVHSVVTLPITKSQYSFIGSRCLQQTSCTGWRFRTMDSDGAAFSPVITREAAGHKPFSFYCPLNVSCRFELSSVELFCIKSIQSHYRPK